MKSLMLLVLVTGISNAAMARTSYEVGYGNAVGYCSGNMGQFCIDGVKRQAENDGNQRAEFNCQMKHGMAQTFAGRCSTSCFPSFIGPQDRNTPVRCNASCTLPCQIPD